MTCVQMWLFDPNPDDDCACSLLTPFEQLRAFLDLWHRGRAKRTEPSDGDCVIACDSRVIYVEEFRIR
jgi:hypothetical protein